MASLKGRTIIITGGSRGIGKAIALRCAADGANVVIAAKTVDNSGKLKGTIHEAAEEVEKAGGRGLAVMLDVRDPDQVAACIDQAAKTFGGIDAVVNNAGAIMLAPVQALPPKRFDLMMQVNVRGSYLLAHYAIPYLKKSDHGHILMLSPPIDLDPKWFGVHAPYTITKYGMTMLAMGLARELASDGVAANALWPRTTIATAAVDMLGGDHLIKLSRTVEIMSDAAYAILSSDPKTFTGRAVLDEDLLRERGVTDFSRYAVDPTQELALDLFVPGYPYLP